MSKRFTAPSAEELAARGLNPDGTAKAKPTAKAAKAPEPEVVAEPVDPKEGDE